MSTLVAPRSRAAARVNRISVDLDRSSGYLLGSLPNNVLPSSSAIRRARESSLTSLGRVTSDTTTSSVRMRDSSLTRGGRLSATESVRNSVMIPSSFETAKYNREQEMKEIHLNFMKQYDTTKKKLADEPVEDTERKSKAYQRIVNNDPPRYLDEREAKKACVSEMFMDTSKFSTKTLSAINGLDGAVLRKKDKEYTWRKEMDDYEKRTEFERDVRARNVSALHRKDPEEDHWTANQRKSEDRKRTSRDTIEKPIEKAAKKEEVVKSWREKREAERATEQNLEPEPGRLSWREKLAEKQKQEEEEKKQKEADAAEAAASAAAAKQRALAAAADATADSSTKSAEPTADGEKTAEEEDEDLNGTGQLKKDVGFLFSTLEQDFEESKSARAKLKERIKKVKTAIKEADDAEATENGETITKESEEEKDKRRAELREKFRLQREAKKKAKAEAGQ